MKFCLWLVFTIASTGLSRSSDEIFSLMLNEYVDSKGLINYAAFGDDRRFDAYIMYIGQAKLDKLNREQKLAFYLNAYNALVIENVLNNWPIDSPMDVEGFFKNIEFNVAGEQLTLDDIEYTKIFAIDDVAVHFGLVCAALSCPRLVRQTYHADSVWVQLEKNGRYFINQSGKNKLDRDNNILYLSKIFDWFQENFKKKFGNLHQAVAHYSNPVDAEYILRNLPEIQFLEYDWHLNQIDK